MRIDFTILHMVFIVQAVLICGFLIALFFLQKIKAKNKALTLQISTLNQQLNANEQSTATFLKEEAELQSRLNQILDGQKNIEEQRKKLEEKNKKIWRMGESALKEKQKSEEMNIALQQEREKLEVEKKKLDEKVKKLWQTSTAIHKEKERINSLYEQIDDAKKQSDALLLNILPAEVAEELKAKGEYIPKQYDEVSVLFSDFKNFTISSERLSPGELVNELNVCFKHFDEITGKYNIEKIKTVGDAYLAAAGIPTPNQNHAEDLVKAAIEMRDFMLNRRKELGSNIWEMRIGIHSGSVVAGIVGTKKYLYDIWGDTVNTASRMEQNSEAGRINISHTTYELVKDKFDFEYRGEIAAKNKGMLKMYFVNQAPAPPNLPEEEG